MSEEATTSTTDGASTTPDGGSQDSGHATEDKGGTDERRYTKADLELIVKDRLSRQKSKLEADKAAADAEAETKAKLDQGKFKEVAEAHAARVKELEPAAAKVERYDAFLKTQLETARKDLPPHIIGLLDKLNDKLDTFEQLEWIAANREALGASTNGKANGHVPGTPKPDGGKELSEAERVRREKDFALTGRRFF